MEDKIVFDDLDIEFTDEDLDGIDEETLTRCHQKLDKIVKELMN